MPNFNSINTIKDYFSRHSGIHRINRFDIGFESLPSGIFTADQNINALLDSSSFYPILDATIGGRGMEFVADNLSGYKYGRLQPRSQNIIDEVMINFAITNDVHLLTLFNNWFNYLYCGSRARPATGSATTVDTTRPFYVPYYKDAVKSTNMTLRLLNPNGEPTLIFKFYEVMPKEMLPIELTMEGKGTEFLKAKILFTFKEFTQTPVTQA